MARMTDAAAGALEAAARRLRARHAPGPGKTLVLGGARSGKSLHAERLLAGTPGVTYVATGLPPGDGDAEWAARVAAHRERRPARWATVETDDLAAAVRQATGPLLVDCLGTWLSRAMDGAGAWQEAEGWRRRLNERVDDAVAAFGEARVPVVAVSNEVGSGVVPATPAGRLFRDVLGSLNARVAERCDTVSLAVAGRVIDLPDRGGPR